MTVFDKLLETKAKKGGAFLLLIDPDRTPSEKLPDLINTAEDCDVDALLVGSSFVLKSNFHETVKEIKAHARIPLIIFPGAHSQISPYADAILFTSLISGRNPQYLIDEQVKGAPLVRDYGLEPIPTGYMLIESGRSTSVEFISNTMPIPSGKTDIVSAHAMAAEYLGMKMVFMEAGSGADKSVPDDLIKAVAEYISIPILVGGGIKSPEAVAGKIEAGASFVVVGDHFENSGDYNYLHEFSEAAHPFNEVTV